MGRVGRVAVAVVVVLGVVVVVVEEDVVGMIFRGKGFIGAMFVCYRDWRIMLTTLLTPSTALGWNRSSSFERHKRREREGNNYFRPEDAKR